MTSSLFCDVEWRCLVDRLVDGFGIIIIIIIIIIILQLICTIKRTIFKKVRTKTILKIYNRLVLPTFYMDQKIEL